MQDIAVSAEEISNSSEEQVTGVENILKSLETLQEGVGRLARVLEGE